MPFSRSRSMESMTRSADLLVGAEGAGLAEHGVDQRGLAVVDVGHDGDIAEIGALHEESRRVKGGTDAAGAPAHPGYRYPALPFGHAASFRSPRHVPPAPAARDVLHALADQLPPGLEVPVAHALARRRPRPSWARMPSRSTACWRGSMPTSAAMRSP